MLLDFYNKEIHIGEIVRSEHFDGIENVINYYLYDYKDNSKWPFLLLIDKSGNVDFNNSLNTKVDDAVSLTKTYGWKWVRLGPKEEVLKELFQE